MTPYEMSRLLNSPAMLPHKEAAVQLVSAQYGQPAGDNWYRDSRVEAVALLLYSGALAKPGAATGSKPDPRLAAIEAKWPGLVAKLAG